MDGFSKEIKENSRDLDQNFHYLQPLLENKRFVFLGESSHCVKEYSETKVNLIKYLHKQLDFRVLAFESEMGDCFAGDHLSPNLDASQFMTGSIGRAWHNEYNYELFHYLKSMKSSYPLHFVGVDVQQSEGKHFSSFLMDYLDIHLQERYLQWECKVNELLNEENMRKRRKRRPESKEVEREGMELLSLIKKQVFPDVKIEKVIIQTIENRLDYFKATMEMGFSKLFEYRDEQMAKNLEFLSQEIFPNDKFIIWAHNLHIKKKTSAHRFSAYQSFVESLPDSMKQDSFVVGFYAKDGEMGDYNGQPYPIRKSNKKHLESILSHSPYDNCFIPCEGLDWGRKKWKAFEGGGMKTSFIPSEQYNGIFFYKKVHPALIKTDRN
ncbi:erythromycin esterase family protein [Oceanobacillus limi]|nr:erythromycin esterase family protein [Oceanobacillus limi]